MSSISNLFGSNGANDEDVSTAVQEKTTLQKDDNTAPTDRLLIDSDSDDDLDVDYSTANMAEEFEAPPCKVLNLRVSKHKPKQAVMVDKDNLREFVRKVSYYIQKKVGKFDILYPVKCKNKPTQWLSIATKNLYIDEALKIFYEQVKSNAVIKWTCDTQAPPARAAKSCEKLHKEYLRNPEVNRKSYEMLSQPDTMSYLEVFLSKLKLIRLVLGDIDAINLLGPSHFKCPLKSCGMVVSLRSFNNMTDITRHLSQHKSKGKGIDHEIASNLLTRYHFLTDEDSLWIKEREEVIMNDLIEQLNHDLEDTGVHLDIYVPTRQSGQFKGKQHWMDEEVVIKLVNYEDGALDLVKDIPCTIDKFFKPQKQKRPHKEKEGREGEEDVDHVVRDPKIRKDDVGEGNQNGSSEKKKVVQEKGNQKEPSEKKKVVQEKGNQKEESSEKKNVVQRSVNQKEGSSEKKKVVQEIVNQKESSGLMKSSKDDTESSGSSSSGSDDDDDSNDSSLSLSSVSTSENDMSEDEEESN